MAEHALIKSILLRCAHGATRLFRINAGQAWTGEVIARTPTTITLKHPRVFHGAPAGFPDLIGMRSTVITQDMVGKRVAIFVALEAKHGSTRVSSKQRAMVDAFNKFGAIAAFVRSEDDAERACNLDGEGR